MSDSLQRIIDEPRPSAHALEDPEDQRNDAILHWMRAHNTLTLHHQAYAFGNAVLPPAWRTQTVKFANDGDAARLLRDAKGSHAAMTRLRAALTGLGLSAPAQDDAMIAAVASMLADGRVWLMHHPHRPRQNLKTDPAVYAALNAQNRTQVDFAYLSRWEGGQYLRGYVPFEKDTGKVAGASGMTIATGFDIGQKSDREMDNLGLAADLLARLKPFADLRFKGKTRAEVAAKIAGMAPVPVITQPEANDIDRRIHGEHLNAAITAWNTDKRRAPGLPTFEQLPGNWQTVLFSRTFHQGTKFPTTAVAQPFYNAAMKGKWADAVKALREYAVPQDWYKLRVGQEADLLNRELPKALPQPASDSRPGQAQAGPQAPATPAPRP